jgi:hypothetical protein
LASGATGGRACGWPRGRRVSLVAGVDLVEEQRGELAAHQPADLGGDHPGRTTQAIAAAAERSQRRWNRPGVAAHRRMCPRQSHASCPRLEPSPASWILFRC